MPGEWRSRGDGCRLGIPCDDAVGHGSASTENPRSGALALELHDYDLSLHDSRERSDDSL